MKSSCIFFLLAILTFFSCKNKEICSINQNNAGKQVYDFNEASCFIALKLKEKAPKLELIQNALLIEESYMTKIGLISDETISENELESDVELNTNKLVEFALGNDNIGLTKEELTRIYDKEIEYLKFIGVVD
ncbi:MAG: hypothetical protein COA88_15995 [Kordia sp.]|nr:MAG: hypothetical protein COA88_15995 [Kordia sp.]